MSCRDLTGGELLALEGYVQALDPQLREMIHRLMAEVRRLRENESNTRFLMEIEGEV